MNLGFFTMPMHPRGKDWRQCLAEDRELGRNSLVLMAEKVIPLVDRAIGAATPARTAA